MLHHLPFLLELSHTAADRHRGLNKAVNACGIDTALCCSAMLRDVCDALSSVQQGGYAGSAAELESPPIVAIGAGDVIMAEGSLGWRMETIVSALDRRFPDQAARRCGDVRRSECSTG
jgi:UDP-N-acetylmuramoyl-tripeptide--D-alanyl-D-alanine ligase